MRLHPNPFMMGSGNAKIAEKLADMEHDVKRLSAAISIVNVLHEFSRDDRVFIVKRVREVLGCDLVDGGSPTGMGC